MRAQAVRAASNAERQAALRARRESEKRVLVRVYVHEDDAADVQRYAARKNRKRGLK
jgi:hypothetical protein